MKAFVQYFNEVFCLLENDSRRLPLLILLFFSTSMLDLIGLGLIGPYFTLIVSPDLMTQGGFGKVLSNLGFSMPAKDLIISMGLILIFIFMTKAIATIIIHRKILQFIVRRQISLQTYLMEGYQSLPYVDYIRRNSSEYINTIGNLVMTYTGLVLHNNLYFISEGIVGVVILSFLAYTDIIALVIFLIIFGSAILIYDQLFRGKLKNYGKKISIGHTEMLTGVQEGFSGFKEIKILGKTQFFTQMVTGGVKKAASSQINSGVIKKSPSYVLEFMIITFIVLYLIGFLRLGKDVGELVGTIGVFMVAALRMKPIANSVINGMSSNRLGRYAVSSIYKDYIAIKSQSSINLNINKEPKSFSSIVFNKISYKYPNADDWALKDISLSINIGESIGIIGPSGAGKTTLLDVLLGLLHPQKGEILYNNCSLKSNVKEWQSNVAYLPQEIFIFDNTLKQNIALNSGDNKIDNNRINIAIQQAQLTELVTQLPLGVETNLGEHGVRLSGGQRQRVAMARAFYHQREVLVMDEATSSLDEQTEKEIVAEMKRLKKQKTIVIIAHRLSTVKHCNRIYRLDKGKIIETGNYDQVVNNKNKL